MTLTGIAVEVVARLAVGHAADELKLADTGATRGVDADAALPMVVVDAPVDGTIAGGAVEETADLVGRHGAAEAIGVIAPEAVVVERNLQHTVVGSSRAEEAPGRRLAADGFEVVGAQGAATGADEGELHEHEGLVVVGVKGLLHHDAILSRRGGVCEGEAVGGAVAELVGNGLSIVIDRGVAVGSEISAIGAGGVNISGFRLTASDNALGRAVGQRASNREGSVGLAPDDGEVTALDRDVVGAQEDRLLQGCNKHDEK